MITIVIDRRISTPQFEWYLSTGSSSEAPSSYVSPVSSFVSSRRLRTVALAGAREVVSAQVVSASSEFLVSCRSRPDTVIAQ